MTLFPYSSMRTVQKDMIETVEETLKNKSHMVVHAPTGLGKTAATLSPALKYAIDNNKTVFFLTSRHTQHVIAIETLKEIQKKHGNNFTVVDLIGKKHMCSQPGIDFLRSSEFTEFCKKQREENKCEYYTNTRKGTKLTVEGSLAVSGLKKEGAMHIEQMKQKCADDKLCSYEVAIALAQEAKVVVGDYYYIFHDRIREAFFKKAQIHLDDSIVIVDEGHNLPDRIRNLMTVNLSNNILKRAILEAKKIEQDKIIGYLVKLQDILNGLSSGMGDRDERLVSRVKFEEDVSKIFDYELLIDELTFAASLVKEKEKRSSIGTVVQFLNAWTGPDDGYVRLISQHQTKQGLTVTLSYRCLDPSLITRDIIKNTHSTILMSGTLQPTRMFRDLLGFPDNTLERSFRSPFPQDNRLCMIVPETSTKYSLRGPKQFQRIAEITADITNSVPGNSAIFFPSYYLRNEIYKNFVDLSSKTAFLEDSDMSKEEKGSFLDKFKQYKDSGAVLLGAISGSFGEGVDLPGDLLKCVIVVGLPLSTPNLETKKLIEYYDSKYGRGWDYGYIAPAFTKTLQSAGRCIRSETDRGIIVFLDERYPWNNYFRHFPADWEIKITRDYKVNIEEFFKN